MFLWTEAAELATGRPDYNSSRVSTARHAATNEQGIESRTQGSAATGRDDTPANVIGMSRLLPVDTPKVLGRNRLT